MTGETVSKFDDIVLKMELVGKASRLLGHEGNIEDMLSDLAGILIGSMGCQTVAIMMADVTSGMKVTVANPKENVDINRISEILENVNDNILIGEENSDLSSGLSEALGVKIENGIIVNFSHEHELKIVCTFINRLSGFTETDIESLQSVSGEIMGFVKSNLSFSRLQRKISQLNEIMEATLVISSSLELEKLLDNIMEIGMNLLNAEGCSVLLIDEESKRLRFVAASGMKKEEVKKMSLALGEGVAGSCAQTGEEVLVSDASDDPRFSQRVDEKTGIKTTSVMCVPLKLQEKIIGVVEVINKKDGGHFMEDDLVLFRSLAAQSAIAIEKARLYEDLDALFRSTVKTLAAAIDAKDPYTRGHSERVAKYSQLIGTQLGLDSSQLKRLWIAAQMHDIGKIGVSESILRKEEKLSHDEWNLAKKHPAIGADMLAPIKQFADIVPSVRSHHERYDGGGYPDGLKGEDIPLFGRIMAVADSYDAMTSDRPYRGALTNEYAFKELKEGSGKQFDAPCVEAFLKAFEGMGG